MDFLVRWRHLYYKYILFDKLLVANCGLDGVLAPAGLELLDDGVLGTVLQGAQARGHVGADAQ